MSDTAAISAAVLISGSGTNLQAFIDGDRRATGRLRDLELGAHRVPALAVLGQVDRLG